MHLKIHKEGLVYFIVSLLITIIILPFSIILSFVFITITIYIFYFFRDPIRLIPKENFLLSPADGVVTSIGEANSPITKNNSDKFNKISIFLNIFNVHVNRIPTDGIVEEIKYIHGKFINATLDKSSDDNERNIILIAKTNNDKIIITQIAGLIARRIVSYVKKNQQVKKGHRFGIIKFGSRVDIYMPLHYKPLVAVGQTVIGGETILANPENIKEITQSYRI